MSILDQESLFADVVQRLRVVAEQDRAFDAAQMQLVNLTEIIRAAGGEWPRIKDKIRVGSMSFLRGCLGDEDIVIPAGDGFLIIFADHDGVDVKARADELREMLLEFYLGEEGLKALGIKLAMRKVSSAELHAMIRAPQTPAPSPEASTHSCLFAPVWTARARAIASYFCLPVQRKIGGNAPHGYDDGFAAHGRNEHRDYCALDLGLLDIAKEALYRYKPGETRPAIGVSVHSTTMQNRLARGAYLERFAAIPYEHAKHLFIKIAEIELGTPSITLADWAGMLRARTRHILLQFHHSEPSPPNLTDLGVDGVGYQALARRTDIETFSSQAQRWGASLARQRLRFFIEEVRCAAFVRAAAQAGAVFVTSEAVWPYQKWPGAVVAAPAPAAGPSA
jgi:hypothetical protein